MFFSEREHEVLRAAGMSVSNPEDKFCGKFVKCIPELDSVPSVLDGARIVLTESLTILESGMIEFGVAPAYVGNVAFRRIRWTRGWQIILDDQRKFPCKLEW